MQALFTDGGVILKNPSSIGGTWCYCLVEKNCQVLKCERGILLPQRFGGMVTNNHSELYALGKGIWSLPIGWEGVVYCDSLITLSRIFRNSSMKNVPDWLVEATLKVKKRLKTMKVTPLHVDGHPTKLDMAREPHRKWNAYCDKSCGEAAKEYLRTLSRRNDERTYLEKMGR